MEKNAYELIAMGARYWFILLSALVAWRGSVYLLREHFRRRKMLKKLPDAGMVGELRDEESGKAYPLPREGVLGGGRACDIRLRGLRRRHMNFAFVEGKGLLLTPCHGRSRILLDGAALGKGGYALHGDVLGVGGYTLRVRLFAGLNVPHPAAFRDHWQRAFEEELYAPEPVPFAAEDAGYAPYPDLDMPMDEAPMADAPYDETETDCAPESAVPYDDYAPLPLWENAPDAPSYAGEDYAFQEEDEGPQAFDDAVYGGETAYDSGDEEHLPVQIQRPRRRRSDRRNRG